MSNLHKVTMAVDIQTGTLTCSDVRMCTESRAEAYHFLVSNLHECLAHADITVTIGEGDEKCTHVFSLSPLRYCAQALRNFKEELEGV